MVALRDRAWIVDAGIQVREGRQPLDARKIAREDALAALATITGWDAREGGKKTSDQASASYLAECRP